MTRATRGLRAYTVDMLLASAVTLTVAAPLLFTRSGFALDFTNHLWLVWAAGKALVQSGHPAYFINTTTQGVFNPWFAFYGGTLYMTTGAISELLGGHPVIAYVGVTVLAIAGAYAGTLWLGRQFGLRRWIAHAPALTVVTSAYYITNLYGRGAWAELIAASSIPPLLASGVHLTRAPTWRPWPMLVFVVSAVFFTGSHNVTLLWGTTIAVIALLVLWISLGCPRRLPYRRMAMVAGLGLTATLINAWFLVTDIAHAGDVKAHIAFSSSTVASFTSMFDTPGVLLDPLRQVPARSTTHALYIQAPDWFLIWGLLTALLLLGARSTSRPLRRAWVAATIVIALLLGMIMLKPFWEHLPNPFTQIQFPYRLNTFVVYAIAGLVLVSALALQRATIEGSQSTTRPLLLALLVAIAVSFGLCQWQEWVPTVSALKNRSEALVSPNVLPRSWYDGGSYLDSSAPIVVAPPGRTLTIPPSQVQGDRFAASMQVPPGRQPIQTNIAAGDYLVRIVGLEWLGRGPNGFAVVRRPNDSSGPVNVTVETGPSRAIKLGWALSILAILSVIAVLIVTAVRASRETRSIPAERSDKHRGSRHLPLARSRS